MIKEQIINTAFDLFSQYGIKSVSMDDVAKAAGISKRTLYESFEDKETAHPINQGENSLIL